MRVAVKVNPARARVEVYLVHHGESDQTVLLIPECGHKPNRQLDHFVYVPHGEEMAPSFVLDEHWAAMLYDQLKKLYERPDPEKERLMGRTEAQLAHLEDMRAIVFGKEAK